MSWYLWQRKEGSREESKFNHNIEMREKNSFRMDMLEQTIT